MVFLKCISIICVIMIVDSLDAPYGPTRGLPGGRPGHLPPPSADPENDIAVNNCCNETREENRQIRQELNEIKDLLNTLIGGPEIGGYCPDAVQVIARDCYDIQQTGLNLSGVYTIQPKGSVPFSVYCDLDTDGGGWTVFQRRQDGSEDFFREWNDYETGFGSLEGEYWLGNEKLYYLTNQQPYGLRVDLEDFEDVRKYAKYDSIVIADSADDYRISLGSYTGDAGDDMRMCDDHQFSTRDRDNDVALESCANLFKGGWWYETCHAANPNGLYLGGPHDSYADGIEWNEWKGYYYSLKFTELKLRPV